MPQVVGCSEFFELVHRLSAQLAESCPSFPDEVREAFAVQLALAATRQSTGRAPGARLYELGGRDN
jgi:hypothetical protein